MTGRSVPTSKEAAAGAAVYSRFVLAVYDLEVLGLELPVVFGCSARRIRALYDANVSDRHLDVGVGTGYFLDRCTFPVPRPVVHLMDLNENCLATTSRRIARYAPVAHRWNVLDPPPPGLPRFRSIGASNFLHCLPGKMAAKEAVFRNLVPLLEPGGVFFGTTVLGKGVEGGALYRWLNGVYNNAAIFSNRDDGPAELEQALRNAFRTHSLE